MVHYFICYQSNVTVLTLIFNELMQYTRLPSPCTANYKILEQEICQHRRTVVSRQQYMLEFYKICTRQQKRDNAEDFLTVTVRTAVLLFIWLTHL